MSEPASVAAIADWRDYQSLALPQILDTALRHFVEHGYHATTVRMIARDVGVTVPALYYHFENKQAMLVALLDYAMGIVGSHTDAALAGAGADPVKRLEAFVEAVVLYLAHHRDLAFLDAERRALTPENLERYVASRDRLEGQLRAILLAGKADGSFATPEPQECARAILAMCQGVAGWYQLGGPLTPKTLASRYVALALATAEYSAPA